MRRIAIVGCRPPLDPRPADVDLYAAIIGDVRRFVHELGPGVVIVSGGAAGVDTEAANWRRHGQDLVEYLPDYAKHGKRAPLERNRLIVEDCFELHAWPAPWSRGTWSGVRLAQAAGKFVRIHRVAS